MITSSMRKCMKAATIAFAVSATSVIAPAYAGADGMVRFGVPTWPGVTVKSEVAAQLLEAMGYSTEQVNASPAFALNSLKSDDLDVYLGGWMPTEKHMIDPLVEEGAVDVVATNITDATMGIAVPAYVWEAGVHTEADLAGHAERFSSKIYGIEPGTGFNDAISAAIDNDRHGLEGWSLVESSTSGMLSQVGRAIDREEWVVFLGWEPHWMNAKYDMKYLESVGEAKIAGTRSDVLTVLNPRLGERHADVARLFSQYVVAKDAQSAWVLEYAYNERDAEDVASEWIAANLDTVAGWLEGVETRDGEPAMDAVRARYAE